MVVRLLLLYITVVRGSMLGYLVTEIEKRKRGATRRKIWRAAALIF